MSQFLLSNITPAGKTVEPAELQAVIGRLTTVVTEMQSAGVWVFAMPLTAPSSATVVTSSDGSVTLADGPLPRPRSMSAASP